MFIFKNKRVCTTLSTNQRMTCGDNPKAPVFLFRCWSFSVFDNPEKRKTCNTEIYKFLKSKLPPHLTYQE